MNARTLSLASLAILAAACSTAAPSGEGKTGTARSGVIAGKNSDSSQDAVVLLVHYDPTGGQVGSCTGALIAPNLVLTARHCVADTDQYAACDAAGEPLAAGEIQGNHKPETMYVFTGKNRPDFYGGRIEPNGQGVKILDDGGKNLCNHDIAMVILKEPIADAPILPIRLDSEVRKGETFTAVGWGVTDTSSEPDVRQQRTNIKVTNVGPDETAEPPVPPNEFQVGESICSGDSGGPAIATETGAILGVVSRGGNATRPDPNDPSSGCINAENLYTKLTPFKDFILKGFELAEAEPWIEGGPDPRLLKPGSVCGDATECRSNLCLPDPDQKDATTCAQDCAASECPEGQVCKTEGDAQICRPVNSGGNGVTTTTTGCASTPAAPSSGLLGLALAAAAVVVARRRRAS
jgi:MYXO-CTERM domain-containing protein